jgi:hypothetical protein
LASCIIRAVHAEEVLKEERIREVQTRRIERIFMSLRAVMGWGECCGGAGVDS